MHGLPRPLSRRQARYVYFWGEDGSSPRYLTQNTAKAGTQVVIPYRDEDEKRHLKVTGDLGQIVPLVRSVPSPIVVLAFLTQMASALGRNGISVTRNRLPSVYDTPISCTTSSAATTRPSMFTDAFLCMRCGVDLVAHAQKKLYL